jgi:hypothetical protein
MEEVPTLSSIPRERTPRKRDKIVQPTFSLGAGSQAESYFVLEWVNQQYMEGYPFPLLD